MPATTRSHNGKTLTLFEPTLPHNFRGDLPVGNHYGNALCVQCSLMSFSFSTAHLSGILRKAKICRKQTSNLFLVNLLVCVPSALASIRLRRCLYQLQVVLLAPFPFCIRAVVLLLLVCTFCCCNSNFSYFFVVVCFGRKSLQLTCRCTIVALLCCCCFQRCTFSMFVYFC